MQRINTPDGLFIEGNPALGIKGTKVTKAWAESLQEEIANVVEHGVGALDPEDNGQLLQALDLLFSSGLRVDPTVADQGAITVAGRRSIKDWIVEIGVTRQATLLLWHTGAADTTDYALDTSVDLSGYPNIRLKIEPGATLSRTTGDEIITLADPGQILMAESQRIALAGLIVFAQPGIALPDWWTQNVNPGVTDMAAAEAYAHAAVDHAAAIMYRPVPYLNAADASENPYPAAGTARTLGFRLQAGIKAAPTDQPEPVIWVQKHSIADNAAANDSGAGYFALIKEGGQAYAHALTGFARYNGGSGDLIGVHGRVSLCANASRGYAGWFYAHVGVGITPAAVHALELNGINEGTDLGYGGGSQLIRLCMADSAASGNRFSTAISIAPSTLGGDNGFYTGIHIARDAIIRSISDDNEAIRIDAPAAVGGWIGGIRFGKQNPADTGVFKYALDTNGAAFVNNNALQLAVGHYIRWGDSATGMKLTGDLDSIQINHGFVHIADPVGGSALVVATQPVVGVRKTGWAVPVGTAIRSGFTTSSTTVEQLAQHLKALIDDLTSHGLIGA